MSLQDKMEQILKNIHLLFSASKPYDESGEWIIVEKEKVFAQLEQLNLAVYEMMDTYEMTNQKHQLAQRRCEKRGEEIIQKANRHADDIYAASIMYTDDAINRICHIMEDANDSVRKVFRGLNNEMERERERVRHNQLELTSQLQDFADTNKYIKLIEEINKKLERERMEEIQAQKEKRIQNEGKSYPSSQPEIHVNEAYLERMGRSYELTPLEINARKEEEESLARVTGKEFAESLRRRAAKSRGQSQQDLEIEDMSVNINIPAVPQRENYSDIMPDGEYADSFSNEEFSAELQGGELIGTMLQGQYTNMQQGEETAGETLQGQYTDMQQGEELAGETLQGQYTDMLQSESFVDALQAEAFADEGFVTERGASQAAEPEIRVDLDAEYFKWKEEGGKEEPDVPQKKTRKSLFGRRS